MRSCCRACPSGRTSGPSPPGGALAGRPRSDRKPAQRVKVFQQILFEGVAPEANVAGTYTPDSVLSEVA
eukprot:403306-Prorocentrum_minimum.AAC.1